MLFACGGAIFGILNARDVCMFGVPTYLFILYLLFFFFVILRE